jgi:hypothetical protein
MSNRAGEEDDVFQKDKAPAALRQNVEQLCRDTGRTLEQMENLPLQSLYQLAQQTYGAELPEYWRIWKDWHENDQIQPMGDL